ADAINPGSGLPKYYGQKLCDPVARPQNL
ncbi:MAG: hypothetical protein JWN34_3029, partial [Bryobacterales bacterium]|nr:hypothetical protein [Bryobacterales bacterium]